MTRAALLGGAAVVLACAVGAAWWARLPAGPPEEEGRAWLAGFADLLVGPQTLGARGAAAAALFPGLRPLTGDGCVTAWLQQDASAPIVTYQRLELGRLPGDGCEQSQFGMLSTTLRQSDGVTPGLLAARFTELFGLPEVHRDTVLGGSIVYQWHVLDGVFIHMDEPVGRGARDFSVLFVRQYASPDHLPTEAEAVSWMDRTVDLLTGPALVQAHGPAAARLVEADMVAEIKDEVGCPTMFRANLLVKGPIEGGETLFLDRPDGARCEDATVSSLFLHVWRRAPVTPEALVTRISAKLGAPTVSRRFDRDEVDYDWTTPGKLAVSLSEGLSGGMERLLILRASRS